MTTVDDRAARIAAAGRAAGAASVEAASDVIMSADERVLDIVAELSLGSAEDVASAVECGDLDNEDGSTIRELMELAGALDVCDLDPADMA